MQKNPIAHLYVALFTFNFIMKIDPIHDQEIFSTHLLKKFISYIANS